MPKARERKRDLSDLTADGWDSWPHGGITTDGAPVRATYGSRSRTDQLGGAGRGVPGGLGSRAAEMGRRRRDGEE